MKKIKSAETLKFLRNYFHIPESRKICWGIIEEIVENETAYRPGVCISGSSLYLDIAGRRFFSTVKTPKITRQIYPAVRRTVKDGFYFTAKEKNLSIVRSKSYIADIYYPALYSKALEQDIVY